MSYDVGCVAVTFDICKIIRVDLQAGSQPIANHFITGMQGDLSGLHVQTGQRGRGAVIVGVQQDVPASVRQDSEDPLCADLTGPADKIYGFSTQVTDPQGLGKPDPLRRD